MDTQEKTAEWMTMDEITPIVLPIRKILLATDGSASSVRATKLGIGLAQKLNAEVLAVYVAGHEESWELPKEQKGKSYFCGVHPCEAGLAVAKAFGEKNGVKVTTTILRGSISRNIVKAAVADEVDLIVMGESGRSAMPKIALGTVAESVMKLSPCPVLIARNENRHNQAVLGAG